MYLRSVQLTTNTFLGDDAYLDSIPAVQSLGSLDLSRAPVTFFVGENGSGKSTLLEAIAVASGFNPEGGSRNFHFSSADTHSGLHQYLRLVRAATRPRDGYFLRAESFYNVASNIDLLDEGSGELTASYGGRSLHQQSHGESFLSLVLNRLGGNGLYILDEPEAALSPSRQLALLTAIHRMVNARSQLLIATHSPILSAYPNAIIYQLDETGIAPIRYEDTEQYRITRAFLDNPKRMLSMLMEDDPANS
ncbi:MAG: AAA family ATPase [Clostridia bacterium]